MPVGAACSDLASLDLSETGYVSAEIHALERLNRGGVGAVDHYFRGVRRDGGNLIRSLEDDDLGDGLARLE